MRQVLFTLLAGFVLAGGLTAGPKPKASVQYARSWDAAVEEARALNLPLIVHRHGFY